MLNKVDVCELNREKIHSHLQLSTYSTFIVFGFVKYPEKMLYKY